MLIDHSAYRVMKDIKEKELVNKFKESVNRELLSEYTKRISWTTNASLAVLAFYIAFLIELKFNNNFSPNLDFFGTSLSIITSISIGLFYKFKSESISLNDKIFTSLSENFIEYLYEHALYNDIEVETFDKKKLINDLKYEFRNSLKTSMPIPEELHIIQLIFLIVAIYWIVVSVSKFLLL